MRTSPLIKATVFLGLAALLVAGCASKKSSSGTPTAASTAAAAAAGGSGAPALPDPTPGLPPARDQLEPGSPSQITHPGALGCTSIFRAGRAGCQ